MQRTIIAVIAVSLSSVLSGTPAESTVPTGVEAISRARVPFVVNQGQIENDQVAFYARTFAGTVFVTETGDVVYRLPIAGTDLRGGSWVFTEHFAGDRKAAVRGNNPDTARVSQFRGSDPEGWFTQLDTFGSIDLGERFPGIDVRLQAGGHNVEKLFLVSPGADVSAIDVIVDGANSLDLDSNRRLILNTPLGSTAFTAPVAYQEIDGIRHPVQVAYDLRENDRYGFTVGAYSRDHTLVIDPLLAATYLGGHNPSPPGNYDDDIIYSMAVTEDAVYVAGVTQSPDFPIVNGYDDTLPNSWPEGFITRFSADLSTVVASTYIGTDGFDRVTDIALDTDGTVVAVGQAGWEFPVTANAYTWSGTTPTGGGFVARFSADLSTLITSSVPTPSDYPREVAIGNGLVFFGGSTNNPNFPITPGAFKTTCCPPGPFGIRPYEGFAGALSDDFETLEAMTYLGNTTVAGLAVGNNDDLYIADGSDHAVTGYLSRFDLGLTSRTANLYYYPGSTSGSSRTYFNDVVVSGQTVIAAGQTYMNDLPATDGAYDTTCGTDGICDGVGDLQVPRSDGFIGIYSDDLTDTIALTYLGASYHESIRSLALAPDGGIIVTGETASVDFPTVGDGIDPDCGIDGLCDPTGPYDTPTPDAFIAKLSGDLSQLLFGSYVGGSGEDFPLTVAVSPTGMIYTAGYTDSADFPTTPGAFDTSYNGGTADAFIVLADAARGSGDDAMIFTDDFESGDMDAWSSN